MTHETVSPSTRLILIDGTRMSSVRPASWLHDVLDESLDSLPLHSLEWEPDLRAVPVRLNLPTTTDSSLSLES